MNENKRLEHQQKMISRQSKQIEDLKSEVIKLRLEIEEKDRIIDSVSSLREELIKNVAESEKYKEESKVLLQELKKMRRILNYEVYKGKWWIIKHLIK